MLRINKNKHMKKDKKVSYYEVNVSFKVRTKAQAKILDKALIDTYAKLVAAWTKTRFEDIQLRFGVK